ncbi:hypothetical protein E2C01_044266 [Portunus trituberculatus]|uniref:Uncharacterized protein n=1 Tax=Portunus trituberculatus TaxID=210409 RepID=A0A5B7FYV2_PORTR|nr:hypothetical protein [Portunus trituberculatus]
MRYNETADDPPRLPATSSLPGRRASPLVPNPCLELLPRLTSKLRRSDRGEEGRWGGFLCAQLNYQNCGEGMQADITSESQSPATPRPARSIHGDREKDKILKI